MKQVFFCFILLHVVMRNAAQTNLQTGTVNFGIPLYSYSDAGNRLGLDISLAYVEGNGLKVSQVSSCVGTGWTINAGGLIQRLQNGDPDDQKNYDTYIYPDHLTSTSEVTAYHVWGNAYYPNGFLYNSTATVTNGAAVNPLSNWGCAPQFFPRPRYSGDVQQDVFAFNFCGRQGSFVIGKPDQNGNSQILPLYDSKLKIQKVDGDLNNANNIRTTISAFQITDENGIQYIFRDANLSEICKYVKTYYYDSYGNPADYAGNATTLANQNISPCAQSFCLSGNCNLGNMMPLGIIKGEPMNSFVKDKWFLSEIKNPLTGRSILFEYENYSYDCDAGITATGAMTNNSREIMSLLMARSRGTNKRLKKITFSSTEEVDFDYAAADRIDFAGDKALDRISIKNNGSVVRGWQFGYGYFVKNSIKAPTDNFTDEDKRWARLCMLSLKETGRGNAEQNPYQFAYYLGTEDNMNSVVPPPFSFIQNSSGYYVSKTFGFYSPTNHVVSTGNVPYEPYGGKILSKDAFHILTYLRSMYDQVSSPDLEARNGMIKSIKYPTGGTLSYEYAANEYGANTYRGSISVSKATYFDDVSSGNNKTVEYKYILENGASSAWGYEPFTYSYQDFTTIFSGSASGQVQAAPMLISFSTNVCRETNASIMMRKMAELGEASSGAVTGQPGQGIIGDYILNVLENALFSYFASGNTTTNLSNTNFSSVPYNTGNMLPYQFSRVEVSNKVGPEGNGKIVYEFTSSADYPLDVTLAALPFSAKPRYAFWLYGLTKKVSFYDDQNNKVKSIQTIYPANPAKTVEQSANFLSQKWLVKNRTVNTGFIQANPPLNMPYPGDDNTTSNLYAETYYPIHGHIEPTSSVETNYVGGLAVATFTTNYTYSSHNYLASIISTTNSKGELVENHTYYPEDYSLAGTIQNMKNNNMVNIPISTQTIIQKNSVNYLISGTVTDFGTSSNSDIKPVNIYTFRNAVPLPSSSAPFSSSALIPNPSYYHVTNSINYDVNGMPAEVISEQGKSSTLYDYAGKLPVATVENAAISDVAYTSFEAEGKGGWTFNELNIVTDFSAAGRKCYQFPTTTASISRTGLAAGTKYILSFWATGAATVYKTSGGIQYFTPRRAYVNSGNGLTYYEYAVTGGTDININNSTSGGSPYHSFKLDELRLYPDGASMMSMTYDPEIGKTAESDGNGRLVYYEYDKMGRLKIIRDENRNVLKTYEYNYKQ